MHSKEEILEQFSRLLDVMDRLRDECPWNGAQTMESIRPLTIEEVYELSDAIVKGEAPGIRKELGDLMYHIVFYSRIARENGDFDMADVLSGICEKMIFRHPHVFGDGKATTAKEIADTWELVKAREKGGNRRIMDGIPEAMPPMVKAVSLQEKARGSGFDWEEPRLVWEKVKEEEGELQAELDAVLAAAGETEKEAARDRAEQDLGDFIFSIVNAARLYGFDPDKALNRSCAKFRRRFTWLEEQTIKKGRSLRDMSLSEMDEIWDEAKALGM